MNHKPLKVDLEQSSEKWLAWRKTKLTASIAPIIMGDSPWSTPFQLWEEMLDLREPRKSNDGMERGKRLEPIVRKKIEEITGIELTPAVYQHPTIDYLACSLDGCCKDGKTVIEIKCPGRFDHQEAKDGRVPKKYIAQLAHIMEVMGVNKMHYYSYYIEPGQSDDEGELVSLEILKNVSYGHDLLANLADFWLCLQEFSAPPMTDKDFVVNETPEWLERALRFKEVTDKLKTLEKEQEDLRLSLIELANNQSTMGAGLRLTKYLKKGAIQYNNIPELKEVDLEKYRKKSQICWRVA